MNEIMNEIMNTNNRYRYDTGCIIDQETGDILHGRKILHRLNRQDKLIKHKDKHLDAVLEQLQKEIDNSSGELHDALVRIANTEIDV